MILIGVDKTVMRAQQTVLDGILHERLVDGRTIRVDGYHLGSGNFPKSPSCGRDSNRRDR